jgi:hypothetical protein
LFGYESDDEQSLAPGGLDAQLPEGTLTALVRRTSIALPIDYAQCCNDRLNPPTDYERSASHHILKTVRLFLRNQKTFVLTPSAWGHVDYGCAASRLLRVHNACRRLQVRREAHIQMPLPYLRSLELVSRLELSMPEVRQLGRQALYILPMRAMRRLGRETRLQLPVRTVRGVRLSSSR